MVTSESTCHANAGVFAQKCETTQIGNRFLNKFPCVLTGATAVLMLYMGIAVPTIHKYHLSRNWIAALVVMYVVFTGLYLANQMGLLFVSPWITPGMFPTQV